MILSIVVVLLSPEDNDMSLLCNTSSSTTFALACCRALITLASTLTSLARYPGKGIPVVRYFSNTFCIAIIIRRMSEISLFRARMRSGAPLMDASFLIVFAVWPDTPVMAMILAVNERGSIT